jgi:hypothetical protein
MLLQSFGRQKCDGEKTCWEKVELERHENKAQTAQEEDRTSSFVFVTLKEVEKGDLSTSLAKVP